MADQQKSKMLEYLRDFVTDSRWKTICNALDKRTRYLTVVLEDIYQPHNASAVLRSCEGFGIQDVHIIENKNEFDPSKSVTIGADQWLTLYRYNQPATNNTEICFDLLRKQGYRIIATSPHVKDIPIQEIELNQKTALVFGAEYTGLSDFAMEHADGYAKIEMTGFSESFNISVSAAICIYETSKHLKESGVEWELNSVEKLDLKLEWLEQSIRESEKIKKRFQEK